MTNKKSIKDYEYDFKRIYKFYCGDVKLKKPVNKLMQNNCKDCPEVVLLIDEINNYRVCNNCGRCYPMDNKVEEYTAKGSYVYSYNSSAYFRKRISNTKYGFTDDTKKSLESLFCRNFIVIMMLFNEEEVYRCNYELLIYNLLLDFNKQAANMMRYYVSDKVFTKYRGIWNEIKKNPCYFKP
ncbi:MAG: hypothetical protein GY804_00475 [Alphaproteobacteria bacterium]|nr:hypothetical protein [Alphaproteobacteria bacterium]